VQDRLVFAEGTVWPQWPGDFYSQIDISLDTYPFGGGITTLESLWNGVPVITRRGTTFVSRLAADYLNLIGKGCWVADTEEEFVAKAVNLAGDLDCLVESRNTLQAKLASSPLLDGQTFARDLERAFKEMLEEASNRAA
jgi:predicted O-linked N-acetylglucosamine transferase (SPINDLY family)